MDAGSRPLHDSLLTKRGYRNRATGQRQRLRIAGRTANHPIGWNRDTYRSQRRRNTRTAITDVNRAAAWGDTENYGILLNNIQAAVTAWPKQDGSDVKPDGLENDLAQKITLYKGNAANGVYYYPMQKKYDYSFYGYAPYQEGQTISAAKPEITFARFDGSQDIIWNNATAGEIAPNSIYLKKDVKNDASLTGYKAQYIRQLKYHHELNQAASEKLQDYPWIPNINFEHQLAQLRFSVIPATEQSEEDRTAVQNMKVKRFRQK